MPSCLVLVPQVHCLRLPHELSGWPLIFGVGAFSEQAEDFMVGVRVRTKNAPKGLLIGEVVLGCGPPDLGLPIAAGCDSNVSGNRKLHRRR